MRLSLVLSTLLIGVTVSASMAAAQEASYPSRPITWVVVSGPGGVTDSSARFYAKVLSEKIGQPIVVDNKPGAAGIVGVEYVAQAKPDGYTMMYASQGPMATFPSLYKKLSYKPLEAFIPVNGMVESSMMLMVNAASPFETVEELVEHLKKNPGKLNYGSYGPGTGPHLVTEMLQQATGTSMTHIPYKAFSNLYADLLSGTIDLLFDYSAVMRPFIESGKLRALAVTGDQRLAKFPDVPTLKERGTDVVLTGWASVVMPAGTPQSIVDRMAKAFEETTRDPAILKYNEENDFVSLGQLGPERLKEFYKSETEKYRRLIDKAGIKLD